MDRPTDDMDRILQSPESDLVVNHVIDRYRKGLYSLIMVTGLPGTGKSSTCFRLKELVCAAFTKKKVTTRIISSLAHLAKFAMDAKPEEIHVGVVEEVSTLFPSRRAMSGDNVDLARILDTCRKKRVILLANAPLWPSIDSTMRAMGNVYVETQKVYKKKGIVISKMFRLQTNPGSGKTYTHTMLRNGKEVKRMYTRMPNAEDWIKYEQEKDKFMEELYIKINKRAELREEKEKKDLGIESNLPKKAKPLTPNELKVYDMRIGQKMKFREIGQALDISPVTAFQILERANKKLNLSSVAKTFSAKTEGLSAHNVKSENSPAQSEPLVEGS